MSLLPSKEANNWLLGFCLKIDFSFERIVSGQPPVISIWGVTISIVLSTSYKYKKVI